MIRMPRTAPLVGEPLVVIGYVVVIRDGGSGNALRGLTNSDLMSQETAEHEAGVWRRKATEQGSSRKFEVCPVIGGGS